METYVVCDTVEDGLRASEVTVGIKSTKGRTEFLHVSGSNLLVTDGRRYLAVGLVHVDPATKQHLIQFPQEADSGVNRIWVPDTSILPAAKVPVS